jgi:transposase
MQTQEWGEQQQEVEGVFRELLQEERAKHQQQLREAEACFQQQLQEAEAHFQQRLREAEARFQQKLQEAEARFQQQLQEERAKHQEQLQEERSHFQEQLRGTEAKVKELQGRLKKDSHNSHKPPSSDGLGKKPHESRKKSEKPSGGQVGHVGRTLMQVATPDTVVSHRPMTCECCQSDLGGRQGEVKERRQVYELPQLRLQVEEHQAEEICCPVCQHINRGRFPEGVNAPAQYGPNVQALAVYFSQFHLLPMERTCEALEDICGARISEGTLINWIQEATKRLGPTMERIKELLSTGSFLHADETGIHIKKLLRWVHVASTGFLTYYSWHRRRGKEALENIGIWPSFRGRAMHDRWRSYDQYQECDHSLCGSHLLRDCISVVEQEQQVWAQDMHDLLLLMEKTADYWRDQGAKAVPQPERESWFALYFHILAMGFANHPPPEVSQLPKKKGPRKQSASKNLLDVFLMRAEDILVFMDDLSRPFTNNQAERDLRMIKVQQKISGTFRTEDGATAFCVIRSYLSTMRKQGRSMLAALAAVFSASPFPIAWAPG